MRRIINFVQIKKYFKSIKNNSIKIDTALKSSKIKINGSNNTLQIAKSIIKNININIQGSNNIITIKEECIIRNTNIIVIGSSLNLSIGKNTQIAEAEIVCGGRNSKVFIGDNVLMAHGIEIRNNDGHSIYSADGTLLNPSKDIHISNNVWLSQHTKILKGAHIGSNSVVAISAVVSSGDYPSGSILAGIPARIVKENISWGVELPI